MPNHSSLSKTQQQQHLQQQQHQSQYQKQHARDVETREHHASANASAGLNLNLFGALSGAFSSKQSKTTHKNADGSEDTIENRHDRGEGGALVRGNGSAYAAGNANEGTRYERRREIEQGQGQGQMKRVEGKKQVDHLGIEG